MLNCALRYFGVFDGHGGAKVAAFCANNLHRHIVRRPEYTEGDVEGALREVPHGVNTRNFP